MRALQTEIETFESKKEELERHHMGKWVVFHDSELVGSFDSIDNAASEAKRRFGRGPYLIRRVGQPPATLPASVLCRPVAAHADR